jgi:formyl-CoA transferase
VPVLSQTPGAIRSAAPTLGEHTDEVLEKIGFSRREIDDFRRKGIV